MADIVKPGDILVDAKIDFDLHVQGTILFATIIIKYKPIDFREYKFDFEGESSRSNWVSMIMYNYIPFALCRSDKPGNYSSFEECTFSSMDEHWDLDSVYTEFELNPARKTNDLFISDMREFADDLFHAPEPWYDKMPGQQFNFDYAFNGGLFFGTTTKIDGFNDLAKKVRSDDTSEEYSANINFLDMGQNDYNKVVVKANVDISEYLDDNYTYALISANPAGQNIVTMFLSAGRKEQEKSYHLRCIPESVEYYDANGNTVLETSDMNDMTVSFGISSIEKTKKWKSTRPRIRFRVEKYYE